jgi:gluconokinase
MAVMAQSISGDRHRAGQNPLKGDRHPQVIIITGVSGSGKSTVGRALAEALGWHFFDGDEFHPPSNVDKMAKGFPLNDADRAPWLDRLHDLIAQSLAEERPAVLACSALKQAYRDRLLAGNARTGLVYLRGDYELIWERMRNRQNHYMGAEMLRSQFDDLEEPAGALVVNIEDDVNQIVGAIIEAFDL